MRAKFQAWQAARNGESYAVVRVDLPPPPVRLPPELDADYFVEQLCAGRRFEELVEELGGRSQLLPQDAMYAWARTELLKDPTRFAQRVGLPESSPRHRRQVEHVWPEIGTRLDGRFQGETYAALVVAAPEHKAGRALQIINGPSPSAECPRRASGAW